MRADDLFVLALLVVFVGFIVAVAVRSRRRPSVVAGAQRPETVEPSRREGR